MGGQEGNCYKQMALDTFLSEPLSCPCVELSWSFVAQGSSRVCLCITSTQVLAYNRCPVNVCRIHKSRNQTIDGFCLTITFYVAMPVPILSVYFYAGLEWDL